MWRSRVLQALQVQRLTEAAVLPKPTGGAGYELFSAHQYSIPPRGKGLVKTDLAIAIPESTFGRIVLKPGLAWKHHVAIGEASVDTNFRGNVSVVLFNHSDKPFEIQRGDGVAQLILEHVSCPEVVPVETL
eukprot:c5706_g1_i1.p1 GENE.c5706_g1_i1~~c5706_g1_i1.p1  ORF type:complete len:131 (+),score=26.44 c5706_g1_i1:43-435(+)